MTERIKCKYYKCTPIKLTMHRDVYACKCSKFDTKCIYDECSSRLDDCLTDVRAIIDIKCKFEEVKE